MRGYNINPVYYDVVQYLHTYKMKESQKSHTNSEGSKIYALIIVGAGPSGLTCAKYAQQTEQIGDSILVLEQRKDIGGVWNIEQGYTWNNMTTNISKYSCAFTDFPWEQDTPVFPPAQLIYKYLKRYSDHFDLNKYISLSSCVTHIQRVDPTDSKSLFRVQWSGSDGSAHHAITKYLVLASGMFAIPYIPHFKGFQSFKGESMHSTSYKQSSGMKHKKVLTIGGSFTGVQLTSDIAFHAQRVIHTFRKRFFLLQHFMKKEDKSIPIDFVLYTRNYLRNDKYSSNGTLRRNIMFQQFCKDQDEVEQLKIAPEDMKDVIPIGISSHYLERVKTGVIVPKVTSIKQFGENTVTFDDGTTEQIDLVVFCTGFKNGLNFLSEQIRQVMRYDENDNRQPGVMFYQIAHPDVPNFYLIGQYKGILIPSCEMQSKMVVKLMTGQAVLPPKQTMYKEMEKELALRYRKPPPQSINSNYLSYGDKLVQLCTENNLNFNQLKQQNPQLYDRFLSLPSLQNPNAFNLKNVQEQIKQIEALLQTFKV